MLVLCLPLLIKLQNHLVTVKAFDDRVSLLEIPAEHVNYIFLANLAATVVPSVLESFVDSLVEISHLLLSRPSRFVVRVKDQLSEPGDALDKLPVVEDQLLTLVDGTVCLLQQSLETWCLN